ncbi:response regulator [candidate division KSB3 bacterium]|uniref:Response regulator n=1 Tax=candidate division KSB3 bacterium TaxID=2044937 RepID=A0A9D5Q6T4_9BACT|nr:response regulator [candidate division KSB3 bacterium]MBD3326130.1 response regulator [candidate division KSB3 bacterium]
MSHKILIVEDEPGMIELLTVALEDEGYLISIANNGEQGLKKVAEEEPDLIISDVMMPDMNGYDFCEQLRADPKTASIPFIFLTAKKDVSDRVRGLNLGADDYISKPFHVVEVVARIKTLMQRVKRARPTASAPPAAPLPETDAAFSGDLEKISIGEVVQTIALTKKTGCLIVTNTGRRGEVYFQEGIVTYADVDRKKGEEGVYRLLSWKNGQFKFDVGAVAETQNVQKTAESLLMEGMRRLDEYNRLLGYFPSPETHLEALSIGDEDLRPEENQVLNYVNQFSTVSDVIDHSKFGDLQTLQILVKLHSSNIIGIKSDEADKQSESMDYDQLAEDLFG